MLFLNPWDVLMYGLYVILPKQNFQISVLALTRENGIPHFLHTRGTGYCWETGVHTSVFKEVFLQEKLHWGCDVFLIYSTVYLASPNKKIYRIQTQKIDRCRTSHTHLTHKHNTQKQDELLPPCRKPLSYVPYKGTYVPYDGTFGAPDQGLTLDVWGGIQQMSTLRWRWHSYVEKSPPQPGMKSCTSKDIAGEISAMILDHTDRNQRYFRSIADPVRKT
jgi:hypothetical protein